MTAARGWAGLCGAITLIATLAACSGSPEAPEPGPTSAPAAPVASHAALGDAPSAVPGPPRVVTWAYFTSPSGNISCFLDKSGVRCDIARKAWKPPPAPRDCKLDWAAGVSVYQGRKATLTCAGDTLLGGAKEELAYGQSLKAGLFTCTSGRKAMRCEDSESGNGFALASERYELF